MSIWDFPSMSSMPAKLTCCDDCSDEQASLGGHLVDALQSCLKAGMEVRKQHAVNPYISIQGGSEIPFYITHIWSQHNEWGQYRVHHGVSTNKWGQYRVHHGVSAKEWGQYRVHHGVSTNKWGQYRLHQMESSTNEWDLHRVQHLESACPLAAADFDRAAA